MDPIQLQLMQQMGMGQVPGIPGTQAPLTIGGGGGAGGYRSNVSGESSGGGASAEAALSLAAFTIRMQII